MSCNNITFSEESLAGSTGSGQIRILNKDGRYYYMSPPPLIGWSSNHAIQGNHSLGYEETVTLSCFASPCGSTQAERTASTLGSVSSVEAFFKNATRVEVLSDQSQANSSLSFNVFNPRVSVSESSFATVVRFNIEFDSFTPEESGSVNGSITDVLHGSTSNLQSIPIASFSDVFNYEPDESLGRVYDDPAAQVFRFSRTCSATARPVSTSSINKTSTFNHLACSGAKAFVDTRMAVAQFSPYLVTEHFKYIDGATVMNLSTSVNVDLSQLSYTVTINGLWANSSAGTMKQIGAFETFNTNVQREANSREVSVSIDGKLVGYSVGKLTDPRTKITAGSSAGAQDVLNRISNNGLFGDGSVVFQRAQGSCSEVLNAVPASVSVADSSDADGSISYNVSYNNRPMNQVNGSITENISISDSYPTDVYASIEIMGKQDGPVFQYMNTTSAYERTLNVELIMGRNITANPSIHSTTRGDINTLISNAVPSSSNSGYVMLKQCNESWNQTEGKYSLTMSWSYK